MCNCGGGESGEVYGEVEVEVVQGAGAVALEGEDVFLRVQ